MPVLIPQRAARASYVTGTGNGGPGASHRQRCHLSCHHSRRKRCRPHLGPCRLRDTVYRPGARILPAQQESSSPASAHIGRVWLKAAGGIMVYLGGPIGPGRRTGIYLHDPFPWLSSAQTQAPVEGPAATGTPGTGPHARRHRSPGTYGCCGPGDHLPDHRDAQLAPAFRELDPAARTTGFCGGTPGHSGCTGATENLVLRGQPAAHSGRHVPGDPFGPGTIPRS